MTGADDQMLPTPSSTMSDQPVPSQDSMKGSKTFFPALNTHLLDPKNLRTENDIKLALLVLENELSTTDYRLIFEHFLSKPNLFEFIFSGKFKTCIRLSFQPLILPS
jgi:hypothetical protein